VVWPGIDSRGGVASGRSRVNGVLVNRRVMTGLRDHGRNYCPGETVQVGQPAQVRMAGSLRWLSPHPAAVASANAALQQAGLP